MIIREFLIVGIPCQKISVRIFRAFLDLTKLLLSNRSGKEAGKTSCQEQ